jgi:hypothetical protein
MSRFPLGSGRAERADGTAATFARRRANPGLDFGQWVHPGRNPLPPGQHDRRRAIARTRTQLGRPVLGPGHRSRTGTDVWAASPSPWAWRSSSAGRPAPPTASPRSSGSSGRSGCCWPCPTDHWRRGEAGCTCWSCRPSTDTCPALAHSRTVERTTPRRSRSATRSSPDCEAWWGGEERAGRAETPQAWKVSVRALGDSYNLDLHNPNRPDDLAHRPPAELIAELIDTEHEVLVLRRSGC